MSDTYAMLCGGLLGRWVAQRAALRCNVAPAFPTPVGTRVNTATTTTTSNTAPRDAHVTPPPPPPSRATLRYAVGARGTASTRPATLVTVRRSAAYTAGQCSSMLLARWTQRTRWTAAASPIADHTSPSISRPPVLPRLHANALHPKLPKTAQRKSESDTVGKQSQRQAQRHATSKHRPSAEKARRRHTDKDTQTHRHRDRAKKISDRRTDTQGENHRSSATKASSIHTQRHATRQAEKVHKTTETQKTHKESKRQTQSHATSKHRPSAKKARRRHTARERHRDTETGHRKSQTDTKTRNEKSTGLRQRQPAAYTHRDT